MLKLSQIRVLGTFIGNIPLPVEGELPGVTSAGVLASGAEDWERIVTFFPVSSVPDREGIVLELITC